MATYSKFGPRTESCELGPFNLRVATQADLPAVVDLVNRAYRGPASEATWSQMVPYLEGDRTSLTQIQEDILSKPRGQLLVWTNPNAALLGCAWVEEEPDGAFYLGTLAIPPELQDAGLGRKLLAAVETWAKRRGARQIRIHVINIREPLIKWYLRRGYIATGETQPFPYGDGRYGRPLRDDLSFVVLVKDLHDSWSGKTRD